jgi:hypothetical protein
VPRDRDGNGNGKSLSEGNQLTAGELMQVIEIKGDYASSRFRPDHQKRRM